MLQSDNFTVSNGAIDMVPYYMSIDVKINHLSQNEFAQTIESAQTIPTQQISSQPTQLGNLLTDQELFNNQKTQIQDEAVVQLDIIDTPQNTRAESLSEILYLQTQPKKQTAPSKDQTFINQRSKSEHGPLVLNKKNDRSNYLIPTYIFTGRGQCYEQKTEQSANLTSSKINYNGKNRQGTKNQAKCQKILKHTNKSHISKNILTQFSRKIRSKLESGTLDPQKVEYIMNNLEMLYLIRLIRLNHQQFIKFVKKSGLGKTQWEIILDMTQIDAQIQSSNKIGTSKYHEGIYQPYELFLIDMNKKVLKIIYRSILRVILDVLDGGIFVGYLDPQAQKDLRQLDQTYERSQTLSPTFFALLKLIQQSKPKRAKKNK